MSTYINLYQKQIKKLQEELYFILEENKILRKTLKEDLDPDTPYDPNADDDNDGIPNRDDPDDDGDGLKDYEDPDHPDYVPPGGGGGGGDYPNPYDDGLQFPPVWYWNKQFLQWLQQNYPQWYAENEDEIRARQENDPDGDGIGNEQDEDDDGDGIPDRDDPDHPSYDPPGGGKGGGKGNRGNTPTAGKYRLPGTTPLDGWRDPVTGIYWSGWYGGHSPDHPRWRPPGPPPWGGGGQGGGGQGGGGGGFGSGGGGFYTGGGKDNGKDGDKK